MFRLAALALKGAAPRSAERCTSTLSRPSSSPVASRRSTTNERRSTSGRAKMLSLTGYAADAGADEDSWALLGQAEAAPLLHTNDDKPAPPLSARSKQRVAASTPATAPVGGLDDAALLAMSPADMAGLMVRLSAHMSGAGSSSNGTVLPA